MFENSTAAKTPNCTNFKETDAYLAFLAHTTQKVKDPK